MTCDVLRDGFTGTHFPITADEKELADDTMS
jgi:hypothetical protein